MCRPQMKRGPLSISAPQNALHWPHMLFDVRLAISAALKYARGNGPSSRDRMRPVLTVSAYRITIPCLWARAESLIRGEERRCGCGPNSPAHAEFVLAKADRTSNFCPGFTAGAP